MRVVSSVFLLAASVSCASARVPAAEVGSRALGCPPTETVLTTIDEASQEYEASGCGHVVKVKCVEGTEGGAARCNATEAE